MDNTTYLSFLDDSRDLSTWERGAPAPQCLSELLGRQSGARAPRSRERRTSFLQDLALRTFNKAEKRLMQSQADIA